MTCAHDEKSFMTSCGYSLVMSTWLVSWRDASVLLQRNNNGERSSLFGACARHTGQSDQFAIMSATIISGIFEPPVPVL